jgi:hypothetical protein
VTSFNNMNNHQEPDDAYPNRGARSPCDSAAMTLSMRLPRTECLLSGAGYRNKKELPRGQMIAVARLTECGATRAWTPPPDSNEYAFGNYEPIDSENQKPRYSLKLEDLRDVHCSKSCVRIEVKKRPELPPWSDAVAV